MSRPRRFATAVLLAASLATGCRNGDPDAAQALADPAATYALFEAPAAPEAGTGRARLRIQGLGTLALRSGALAASDAFIADHPLRVESVPSGTHTVQLLLAAADGDERVAAARVVLADGAPARWREIGWFSVDSGTAAFFDPVVSAAISDANQAAFSEALLKGLAFTERSSWSHAALSFEDHGYVAFSSGFGDGSYPLFVATNASGEVVAALIDFQILPLD